MTAIEAAFRARLITREQWGARRAKTRTAFMPDFGSTLHHEGPPLGDYPHSSCPSKVRGIQAYHMDAKGWADIAYSLMPCRHGAIYECRGRNWRTAANGTNIGNDRAHAVCALVGTGDSLPAELLEAIAIAAAWLNEPPWFGDNLNGHRDWKATACPNDQLYGSLVAVRARMSHLWAGAAPAPPPSAIQFPPLQEDTVRELLIQIPVSDHRGYTDLRVGLHGLTESIPSWRVVGSPCYSGDNPSDGWGPSNRRAIEKVNAGGVARIVIPEHDVASGKIGVYVTVADAA